MVCWREIWLIELNKSEFFFGSICLSIQEFTRFFNIFFVRFLTSLLPGARLAMPPWKLALDPGTRAPRRTRFGVASASTRHPLKDVKPKKRSSLKCETHWPSNYARLPSWRFAGAMKLLGSRGCGGFWVIRYITIFIDIESYWIILNHSWSLLTFLLSTFNYYFFAFQFLIARIHIFSRFRFVASWKSHLPRHPVPLTPSFKWKLCTSALGCACCIGAGACAWVSCLYLAIWKRFEQGPEKKTQAVEFGQPFDLLVEGRNGGEV